MSEPTALEPTLGISESMYYAQIIVDAFSKALQEKQCMSRIPIAVYTESELYIERLKYTLSYFNIDEKDDPKLEPETTFTYAVPGRDPDKSEIQKPEIRTSTIEPNNYHRDWEDECFNCDFGLLPDLDLDQIFADILARIEDFIERIKSLFDIHLPDYCQFAYLLSWICIPDLVAILALLLAAILKLISSIFLGVFSLAAFIMGLLQMIISALLRFIMAMIAYALAPISCLLDALANIANKLPTDEVLEKRLSNDEYALLYGDKDGSRDTLTAISSTRNSINDGRNSTVLAAKNAINSLQSPIQQAADSIDESIEDMFGLIKFLECEPKRSGMSIFEKIDAVIEFMQIINLIISLIDKKAANQVNGFCAAKDEYEPTPLIKGNNPDGKRTPITGINLPAKPATGLSSEDIAEVIENALGRRTIIVVNEEGTEIGVLISKDQDFETRLNIYSCDIPDIIKEYHMEPIIDRATAIPDSSLFGRGPGRPSSNNMERVTVKEADDALNNGDYKYSPFDIKTEDSSINDIIRDLISERRRNQIPSTRKIVSDDLLTSDSGIKKPDTNVSTDDYSLGIKVRDSVPSSTFNKPVELKCGSIDDIQEQFSILKDDK